jgi:hypothetical protein
MKKIKTYTYESIEFWRKYPSDNDMNVNEFIVYRMWRYSWNDVFFIGKRNWISKRNVSGMSGDFLLDIAKYGGILGNSKVIYILWPY